MSATTKVVDGKRIQLTAQEIADTEVQWVVNAEAENLKQQEQAKIKDIATKREAAVEELLMKSRDPKAMAYQQAKQ